MDRPGHDSLLPEASEGEGSRSVPAAAALIITLALAAYGNSLDGEFVYDDFPYIVENEQVLQGGLREAFTEPLASQDHLGLYRPLAVISYQWQVRGGGQSPRSLHLFNAALHAAVSGLLLWVLLRVGARPGTAGIGAALFAVHPAHVEAVTWITGRAELLAALFGLAFLGFMSRRRRLPGCLVGAALWMLACLGKEGALALPGVLLVHDLLRLRLRRPGEFLQRYLPLAVGLAVLVAIRLAVLSPTDESGAVTLRFGPPPELGPYGDLPLAERIPVALNLLAGYLRLSVWPFPTRVFYHHSEFLGWRPGGVVALAACALFLVWRRRDRLSVLLGAGFLLVLFPVLNLRPIGETFAERFLYLPTAFLCPLLADAVLAPVRAERRRRGRIGGSLAVPAAVLAAFLVLTLLSNRHWQSALDLWRHSVAVAPDYPFPHYQLGYFSQEHQIYTARDTQLHGAIREYEEALALHEQWTSQGFKGMPHDQRARAHLNLGIMIGGFQNTGLKDYARARRHLEQALEIAGAYQPLDWELQSASLFLATLHRVDPGVTPERAALLLERALRLDTDDEEIRARLQQELEVVRQLLRDQ